MKGIFHIGTLLGSLAGAVMLLNAMTLSNGAPQQAAGAAMAIGFAVIPYCFARGWELLGEESTMKSLEKFFNKKEPTK